MITLVLLAVSSAQGEDTDSLQLFLQQGDSCMRQYNTFEALQCVTIVVRRYGNKMVKSLNEIRI